MSWQRIATAVAAAINLIRDDCPDGAQPDFALPLPQITRRSISAANSSRFQSRHTEAKMRVRVARSRRSGGNTASIFNDADCELSASLVPARARTKREPTNIRGGMSEPLRYRSPTPTSPSTGTPENCRSAPSRWTVRCHPASAPSNAPAVRYADRAERG